MDTTNIFMKTVDNLLTKICQWMWSLDSIVIDEELRLYVSTISYSNNMKEILSKKPYLDFRSKYASKMYLN